MTTKEEALTTLGRPESTMAQVLAAMNALEGVEFPARRSVGLSSSVTVDLLGTALRRQAYLAGVRLDVQAGNFDDPVGDMQRFVAAGLEHAVLWPFFDSLMPAFEAQLGAMPEATVADKEADVRGRFRLALEQARPLKSVYLGTFHRYGPPAESTGQDTVARVIARFNEALLQEARAFPNVKVIDSETVLRMVGQSSAFDARFYFRGKAPYTVQFANELARRITMASRAFGTRFYKVLAVDCDNTLWGGVVGEDLLGGLKLGPHEAPGSIYWRMQHELVALERAGVLLCLVSKNNPADVDEVLQKHPEMVLRDSHLVAKKVNWEDKPSNLRALASELNLGLASFVFLDDSSFEVEAVRQQLSTVKVLQVPPTLSDYPKVFAELRELFLAGGVTAESRSKTEQYRQLASAAEEKARFSSQDEYLASLGLRVEITRNARASIARISELTQKSNQFNLTTRRYTEAEVERLMSDRSSAVYSLVVADKFGSAGLTGVVLVRYEGSRAIVENFLMSCRVIGRGVETCLWPRVVADARQHGCRSLEAHFVPSAKNAQVAEFYDSLGLPQAGGAEAGAKRYELSLDEFKAVPSPWIELTHVE